MKGSRKDPTPKILYMHRNWVGSVASVNFTFYLKPLLFENIAWTLDSWSLQATGPRLRFPGMRWEWSKGCRATLRWVSGVRPDWEPSRESDQSYNLGSQGQKLERLELSKQVWSGVRKSYLGSFLKVGPLWGSSLQHLGKRAALVQAQME